MLTQVGSAASEHSSAPGDGRGRQDLRRRSGARFAAPKLPRVDRWSLFAELRCRSGDAPIPDALIEGGRVALPGPAVDLIVQRSRGLMRRQMPKVA